MVIRQLLISKNEYVVPMPRPLDCFDLRGSDAREIDALDLGSDRAKRSDLELPDSGHISHLPHRHCDFFTMLYRDMRECSQK